MLTKKNWTFENFKGTGESWKNMKFGRIGTSEKFGGIWIFGISILSRKNAPFEKFGSTEESWKNISLGKNRTSEKFRDTRT